MNRRAILTEPMSLLAGVTVVELSDDVGAAFCGQTISRSPSRVAG